MTDILTLEYAALRGRMLAAEEMILAILLDQEPEKRAVNMRKYADRLAQGVEAIDGMLPMLMLKEGAVMLEMKKKEIKEHADRIAELADESEQ